MIPRLKRDDDALPAARSIDLVDGWLKVFLGLLRLPAAQASGIREELEGHLRERVHDLMVSGVAEGDATHQAISELGEAADVAARYRALRTEPRRRLIMHATLFTAAGAALVLSIAALRGGQPPAPATSGPADQAAADKAQDTRKFLVDVLSSGGAEARREVVEDMLARIEPRNLEFSNAEMARVMELARQEGGSRRGPAVYEAQPVPQQLADLQADWSLRNAPASDGFDFLAKAAKLPIHIRWDLLEQSGLKPATPLNMTARQAGAASFLRAVNEAIGAQGGAAVGLRISDGVLEVATREFFDRREMQLVSYDLSGIVAARMATYEESCERITKEIREAIIQFVSPGDWRDQGGELAEMSVVGDRLFVQAPARMHPQVRWILDQLPAGAGHSDARPPKPDADAAVTAIYPLKHAAADQIVAVLRGLDTIGAIEFNRVTIDAATNSILAVATKAQQKDLRVALECLDRKADSKPADSKAQDKPVGGAMAPPQSETGTVYLTGHVTRPGVYSTSDGGITVRRLLAAAGGLPVDAEAVTITDSRDGQSKIVRTFNAAELRQDNGPDPVLARGQMVCVR